MMAITTLYWPHSFTIYPLVTISPSLKYLTRTPTPTLPYNYGQGICFRFAFVPPFEFVVCRLLDSGLQILASFNLNSL